MYKKYVDPAYTWENFTQEEQSQILLSGRSNNELDTTKLQKMYPFIKNIKDSVDNILKKWINH